MWSQICARSVLYNNHKCNRFATTPTSPPCRLVADINGVPAPKVTTFTGAPILITRSVHSGARFAARRKALLNHCGLFLAGF